MKPTHQYPVLADPLADLKGLYEALTWPEVGARTARRTRVTEKERLYKAMTRRTR